MKPQTITFPLRVERQVVDVDPLDAARGVITGVLLGTVVWAIATTVLLLVRKAH